MIDYVVIVMVVMAHHLALKACLIDVVAAGGVVEEEDAADVDFVVFDSELVRDSVGVVVRYLNVYWIAMVVDSAGPPSCVIRCDVD